MATGKRTAGEERPRPGAVEADVGRRLRAHREASHVSLRELARRLSMSPSALSQIETGKSLPSVSRLYAIVTELGMSLDELFAEDGPSSPTSGGRRHRGTQRKQPAETPTPRKESEGGHVQRSATRHAIDLESGVRWERLTPTTDPGADFLYVTYDVGGASSQGDQFIRHRGREYGLVLNGTLEVTVGFDTYVLGPGDSISFDSTVPHRLRNVGKDPVTGVWFVIGRQSDTRFSPLEGDEGGARG